MFEKIGKITVAVLISLAAGAALAGAAFGVVQTVPEAIEGNTHSVGILYIILFFPSWVACLISIVRGNRHLPNTERDDLSLCVLVSILLAGLGSSALMGVVLLSYRLLTFVPAIPMYTKLIFLSVFIIAFIFSVRALKIGEKNKDKGGENNE